MAVKAHIYTTFQCNYLSCWGICLTVPSGDPHTGSEILASTPVASPALHIEFLHLCQSAYEKCVALKAQTNGNEMHDTLHIGMFIAAE